MEEQGTQPAPHSCVGELAAHARAQLGKRIVGQVEVIEQCLAALLAGGHVLLEGVPGLAKTLLVKSVGELFRLQFQRIQGTSDMMPADLLGTNVFNQSSGNFQFHRGPLFADIVLVDEINRMPPRTQAALLESMEERQITSDGVRYPLGAFFTVFATQNPIEFEGTYPLPEAQLDRFLLKVVVPYPEEAEETQILSLFEKGTSRAEQTLATIDPLEPNALEASQKEVADVIVEAGLLRYITQLVRATRTSPQLSLGASPRAALSLLYVSKALAALDSRNYLIPDDVQRAVPPVLRHRIQLRPEAQLDGLAPDQVLKEVIRSVPVPKQ
jgi:MoxR-like ATPase